MHSAYISYTVTKGPDPKKQRLHLGTSLLVPLCFLLLKASLENRNQQVGGAQIERWQLAFPCHHGGRGGESGDPSPNDLFIDHPSRTAPSVAPY